ncbi:MAG: nahC [Solirubrobacterales bacterium]|nr:nahC [Solirubrobacterales bacterium]
MILRLAHVELGVDDLAAARAFYAGLLGFVEHAADATSCHLRGAEEFDLWSLKLTAGAAGLVHSGFRVSDPADLDAIEAAHRRLGLPTARVPEGTELGQGEALRVLTAEGHRVEFFHEFEEIDPYEDGRLRLPMRDAGHLRGVPPARIDHVSMRVPDLPAALSYWLGELDFSASEYWLAEDGATPRIAWIRRTPRSHDVALGIAPAAAFHHVAFAVSDPGALLRAADLIGDARLQDRLEWGPSRHGATNAFALYVKDPAGNRVELYTGDYVRDLDRPPLLWHPADYAQQGHSWWGNPPPESFGATQPLVGEWIGA